MAPAPAPHAAPPRSSSSLDLLEAPPAQPQPPPPQQTRNTSHSHHPSYAQFALQRLDEATLRRLNAQPPSLALPSIPLESPQHQHAPPGTVLRQALAAIQKVAMPVLLFMAVGCCHLIGWGLLVYGTFAVAASASAPAPSPLLPALGGGGSLLGEADAKGLGFLLYMASVVACGVWLHGYIRQKRRALQQQQQQQQQGVRSPGPMGA